MVKPQPTLNPITADDRHSLLISTSGSRVNFNQVITRQALSPRPIVPVASLDLLVSFTAFVYKLFSY